MPIIRKVNQPDKAVQEEGVLKDNDEVFYCEMSKEIFRNYEDYFDRIMFLNSTVWTCALTSRPNLTYAEALESESEARRVLRRFPYELKAPLVYIASCTQRAGISDLVDDVFAFISTRYFREESVNVLEKKSPGSAREHWRECEVLAVMLPEKTADANAEVDPALVRYKVRHIPDEETKKLPDPFVVTGRMVRRPRSVLSKDKLKLFMKQCVECNDKGMLRVKPASYSKHVTDGGVSKFSDFWVGKAPVFAASAWLLKRQEQEKLKKKTTEDKGGKAAQKAQATKKPPTKTGAAGDKSAAKPSGSKENKKPLKDKKSPNQPDISNYFAKNDGKQQTATAGKKPAAAAAAVKRPTKDELLAIRKAKEEAEALAKRQQAEERERQKVELNKLVASTLKEFNRIAEDLELPDQRPLPVPAPVRTLLPNALLSDALFVLEFMCSFQSVLECTDKFPRGYSLALLERSLLCREVAGPLSDTIQVLLGTVFSLQMDEASEVAVQYAPVGEPLEPNDGDALERAVRDATLATGWSQSYLGKDLTELPMDANTVSELLRLHLLVSGAQEDAEYATWRYQQRGGYRNVDDAGLALRVRHPHIVRALASKTVYQLETTDVLQILSCLVNQILSYSTIRDMIDERIVSAQRARINLRTLIAGERKREEAIRIERRDLREGMRKTLAAFEGADADKAALTQKLQHQLDEKLHALDVRAERGRSQFNTQALPVRQAIFSYQMQLGTDRAHRTYWLFESLPGLFIERPARLGGCLDTPPLHNATLAQCGSDMERNKCIKQMVLEMNGGDKENKAQTAAAAVDRKRSTAGVVAVVGASTSTASDGSGSANGTAPAGELATELLMCSGVEASCPVHGQQAAAADGGGNWAYYVLHTEQELDALINGLNPRGAREKLLKEQLESERDLILHHIKECNMAELQVTDEAREPAIQALYVLPNYAKANLGFPPESSITDVTEGTLIDNIAELERRVTEGHLGKLRVASLDKWRAALTAAEDDGQSDDLRWGPDAAFSKDNRILGAAAADAEPNISHESEEVESTTSAKTASKPAHLTYIDPGQSLSATIATNADADAASAESVFHIARSLLQVSQSIEPQYLSTPFGPSIRQKVAQAIQAAQASGREALLRWQVSLMNATSYAQVFLHYTLLEDAILWKRSTLNADCRVCRRRNAPEKLLLCDGCNRGRHTFCFKPKLAEIPEGSWFCEECKPENHSKSRPKRVVKRKVFTSIDEDDDDDDEADAPSSEEEDGNDSADWTEANDMEGECAKCHKTNSRALLRCEICAVQSHVSCAKLKRTPTQPWQCDTCRMGTTQRRQLKRKSQSDRLRGSISNAPSPTNVADSDDSLVRGRTSGRASNGRRQQRSLPASDSEEPDEPTEDDDEDSQPEFIPAKKSRTSRASVGKRKLSADDDDYDVDDDDDGNDSGSVAAVSGRRSNKAASSRRSSQMASKKRRTGGSTKGRSSIANGRSSKHHRGDSDEDDDDADMDHTENGVADDDDDDDDVDDEDDQPLSNGRRSGGKTTTTKRRSRRAENGGSEDQHELLLDAVGCYELLKQVARHRDAWPFERPVNRTEVPDYYLVIERPMDLAKIKSNLNLGEYQTNYSVMRDVQQIFVNCDLYNTSGSPIYNAGVSLEMFVKECCAKLNLPFKPSDMLLGELAYRAEENALSQAGTMGVKSKSSRKSRS